MGQDSDGGGDDRSDGSEDLDEANYFETFYEPLNFRLHQGQNGPDISTKSVANKLNTVIDDWNAQLKRIHKESSSIRMIVVWGVLVDGGGIGHELLTYSNVEVCVFRFENGWDFDWPRSSTSSSRSCG